MIIFKEPLRIGNDSYLRVIRRHILKNQVYLTDMFYRLISDRVGHVVYCIVRNLTQWENAAHLKKGVMHPLRYTVVIPGIQYRETQLFAGDKTKTAYDIARSLPIEMNHTNTANVDMGELVFETTRLIPDGDSILTTADPHIFSYISKSQKFHLQDEENVLLAVLLREERFPFLALYIWNIAECYLSHKASGASKDDSEISFEEEIYSCFDTDIEINLLHQLYGLGFFDKLNKDPTIPASHPDDGIYLSCLQGRYILIQYINHYHGEFRYHLIDIFRQFVDYHLKRVSFGEIPKSNYPMNTPYANLFESVEDFSLGDDILI